jgi:quercetin dioxygenase-like cupin family protein
VDFGSVLCIQKNRKSAVTTNAQDEMRNFVWRTNKMSTNAPGAKGAIRHELTRLPFLAGTLLQFNLLDELRQLRNQESWQRDTGRSSKTLAKYSDLHVVLVLMKSHSRMNEHHVDGRTSLHILHGRIRIHLPERSLEARSNDLLALDSGILHDVEALEESAFLITISWPGGTKEERHATFSLI